MLDPYLQEHNHREAHAAGSQSAKFNTPNDLHTGKLSDKLKL